MRFGLLILVSAAALAADKPTIADLRRLVENRSPEARARIGAAFGEDNLKKGPAVLFEGGDFFIASMVGLALTAPGYTLRDINDWFDGQNLSAERLVPHGRSLGLKALGGDFKLPVFVIQGAEDFTTPTSLARTFVESIRAPRKAFVAIPEGGHFAVFMKRDAFLRELVATVLPAIVPAARVGRPAL